MIDEYDVQGRIKAVKDHGLLDIIENLPKLEIKFPHNSAVCHAKKKNPKNRTIIASTACSVILA